MHWIKRLFRASHADTPLVLPRVTPPGPVPAYTRYRFSEPGIRIAAVGDLHGRVDLLNPLGRQLDALAQDPNKFLLEIYLGDYIDRGGSSREVIDFLVARRAMTDRTVVCLEGNHEQLLLQALDDDKSFRSWLKMGGDTTLHSYGITPRLARTDPTGARHRFRAALPPAHLEFFQTLETSYACGGFFFAHAGVRPGIPLAQQQARDLLWIRDGFLRSSLNFGAIVVHGHTPTERPQFMGNRIGIDTGAYNTGRLTCLTITSEAVTVLQPPGRVGAGALLS